MYQEKAAAKSRFFNLPAEIRMQVYSCLFIDVCRSKVHRPACPGILLTCRVIYLEAVSILYRKRCFAFDIAGGLLGAVVHHSDQAIRRCRPSPVLGYFNTDNIDYTRVEAVRVNFWHVDRRPSKANDARHATIWLCRQFQRNGLRTVSVVFHGLWLTPYTMAASTQWTDAEHLLQPFKMLRGIEEVHIEMPIYRVSKSESASSMLGPDSDKRPIQSQVRCMEEVKFMMMGSLPSLTT
ncbi:MAG: hypothetical protein Q9168_008112 [Polycauliona sp. 1 TL-2023]